MKKEKKGKKTTAVLLAVLVCIILPCLAGCQSGGEPDSMEAAGTTTAATTEATTAAATEGTGTTEPGKEATEETSGAGEPTNENTQPSTEGTTEHTHTYTKTVTAATCTADGYTNYVCSCGDSYRGDYVGAVGHSWGSWVTVKKPTESAVGKAERTCSRCGATEAKELPKEVPNHTHKYSEKVTKSATCTAEGVKTFTCSCGDSYTESIAKLGHSYKDTVTAPTCTADGYTVHKCSRCGDSYTDSKTSKLGHSWGGWVTVKAPTASSTGTAERTCSRCSAKETKTLDKLTDSHTHSYDYSVTRDVTCTADGIITYKCVECGHSYTESIPATGHNYASSITKSPTCSAEGVRTYTCLTCGDSYTESVPKSGDHSWVHHHTDEVGHEEWYYVCHCGGWSCRTSVSNWDDLWFDHVDQAKAETGTTAGHSYYSASKWIVDSPAVDYDECSVCGTRK